MSRRIGLISALAALSLAALVLAGCGRSGGDGTHPDYSAALKGSPAPLASLHGEANELIPGGSAALDARVKKLKGYPVVANVWASWCGPCQFEFPDFQKVATKFGKKVAFFGINSEDDNAAAKTFLRDEPVPYPSFTDPDKKIADEIGVKGLPDTAFYNRQGELVFLKQGPYRSQAELEEDVRKYALAE
jgi:cytochrome c biogenesis protein CcmG/thiol:disulfide interchange protein DsbE